MKGRNLSTGNGPDSLIRTKKDDLMDLVNCFIAALSGGLVGQLLYQLLALIARRANSMQSVVRPQDAGRDLNPARSPDRQIKSEYVFAAIEEITDYPADDSRPEFEAGWDRACELIYDRVSHLTRAEGQDGL